MKRVFIALIGAFSVAALTGCQGNKTKVGEGALIGTVLGAAAGGIIGHQSGHGGQGAVIGGAVGALSGGVVGAQMPRQQQQQQAQVQSQQKTSNIPAANPNQLTIEQIVAMTKQGANENVIVDRIYLTNSKFALTQQQIDDLRRQGVTQKVIDAMKSS